MNTATLSNQYTLPAYDAESASVQRAHARWDGLSVGGLANLIADDALKTTVVDKKVRYIVPDGIAERLTDFLRQLGVRRVRYLPSSEGVEAPPLRDGEEWRIAEHVALLRAEIDGRVLQAA